MKIGCHVGNSGPLMLEGSIKEALNYGATCFMVYLGPPQNTIRKPIESMNADKMALIAKENNSPLASYRKSVRRSHSALPPRGFAPLTLFAYAKLRRKLLRMTHRGKF